MDKAHLIARIQRVLHLLHDAGLADEERVYPLAGEARRELAKIKERIEDGGFDDPPLRQALDGVFVLNRELQSCRDQLHKRETQND